MIWQVPDLKVDEKLSINEILQSDLDELFKVYSDEEVLKFTEEEVFPDMSYMKFFFESVRRGYDSKEYCELKIAYDNKAIGTCDFHSIDMDYNQCEIGFLLNRNHWGKGIMKKSLIRLIEYLKIELRIKTIIADIEDENTRAIKLVENLGFKNKESTLYHLT